MHPKEENNELRSLTSRLFVLNDRNGGEKLRNHKSFVFFPILYLYMYLCGA